jgi:hypothetical protein
MEERALTGNEEIKEKKKKRKKERKKENKCRFKLI